MTTFSLAGPHWSTGARPLHGKELLPVNVGGGVPVAPTGREGAHPLTNSCARCRRAPCASSEPRCRAPSRRLVGALEIDEAIARRGQGAVGDHASRSSPEIRRAAGCSIFLVEVFACPDPVIGSPVCAIAEGTAHHRAHPCRFRHGFDHHHHTAASGVAGLSPASGVLPLMEGCLLRAGILLPRGWRRRQAAMILLRFLQPGGV